MPTVTDAFNRPDGSPGAGYAAWIGSGPSIVSNALVGISNEQQATLRTGESYGADQWVEFIISSNTNSFQGALLRASGADATRSGYLVNVSNSQFTNWYISRYVNGASVDLTQDPNTGSGQWPVGTVVRAEVIGSTIAVYRNDVLVGSTTDSTHTSGAPGLYFYSNGGIDDATFSDSFGAWISRRALKVRSGSSWVNRQASVRVGSAWVKRSVIPRS